MTNEEAKKLQAEMADQAEKVRQDLPTMAALYDLTAAVLEVARRLPPPIDE